jgi:ferredoxin
MAMVARGVRAIPVGCRGGGCGVCRVQVVSGDYETRRMSRRHVSEEDEAAGYALACRLIALGDLVVCPAPGSSIPRLPPGASLWPRS